MQNRHVFEIWLQHLEHVLGGLLEAKEATEATDPWQEEWRTAVAGAIEIAGSGWETDHPDGDSLEVATSQTDNAQM